MFEKILVKFSEKDGTWSEVVDFSALLNKLFEFIKTIVEAEFDFNV